MSVVNTMNAKRVTDEVRHANNDLELFYLEAKRNKKVASWAAKKLGFDKKAYFLELISEDLSKAGPKPVVDRIVKDFETNKIKIKEDKVWEKVRTFEQDILNKQVKRKKKKNQK